MPPKNDKILSETEIKLVNDRAINMVKNSLKVLEKLNKDNRKLQEDNTKLQEVNERYGTDLFCVSRIYTG